MSPSVFELIGGLQSSVVASPLGGPAKPLSGIDAADSKEPGAGSSFSSLFEGLVSSPDRPIPQGSDSAGQNPTPLELPAVLSERLADVEGERVSLAQLPFPIVQDVFRLLKEEGKLSGETSTATGDHRSLLAGLKPERLDGPRGLAVLNALNAGQVGPGSLSTNGELNSEETLVSLLQVLKRTVRNLQSGETGALRGEFGLARPSLGIGLSVGLGPPGPLPPGLPSADARETVTGPRVETTVRPTAGMPFGGVDPYLVKTFASGGGLEPLPSPLPGEHSRTAILKSGDLGGETGTSPRGESEGRTLGGSLPSSGTGGETRSTGGDLLTGQQTSSGFQASPDSIPASQKTSGQGQTGLTSLTGFEDRPRSMPHFAPHRLQIDVHLSESSQVQVDVGVQHRQVFAALSVDQSAFRNLAMQHVAHLEERLEQAGMTLEEFAAQVGSEDRQEQENGRSARAGRERDRAALENLPGSPAPMTTTETAMSRERSTPLRLGMHVVA